MSVFPATPFGVFRPDGLVPMTSNEENNMRCATPNDENFHALLICISDSHCRQYEVRL